MSDYAPYTCTMSEKPGDADIFDAAGLKINTIRASKCHLDWWCPPNGCTWAWRDGVDPDDPSTWPDYQPPDNPPMDPPPAATT
jgi:hypothetical protein